jgi:hypothetical protein
MRVMHNKPFPKLIISMNSPWLEFSNGILFIKFRRRLSSFPFSTYFLLKIGSAEKKLQQQEEERDFLSPGTPLSVGEMRGGDSALRVDSAHEFRPHKSWLMRHTYNEPSAYNSFLFKNFSPAPNIQGSCLSSPNCT